VSRYFYFRRIQAIEQGRSITCDSGLYADEFAHKFPTLKHHLLWGAEHATNFWLTDRYHDMCFVRGVCGIQQFYRFEHFQENITALFDKLNATPVVSYDEFCATHAPFYFNSTNHKHYSVYYDNELTDLVYQKDRELIQRFNYWFEK